MIIKGGFRSTTKTEVRKSMKYFGLTRMQLERELVDQGATMENGMIIPLQRWFALNPTVEDPLSLRKEQ